MKKVVKKKVVRISRATVEKYMAQKETQERLLRALKEFCRAAADYLDIELQKKKK